MGGYGQSKSLAAHLKQVLLEDPQYRGVELRCPKLMYVHTHAGAGLNCG